MEREKKDVYTEKKLTIEKVDFKPYPVYLGHKVYTHASCYCILYM